MKLKLLSCLFLLSAMLLGACVPVDNCNESTPNTPLPGVELDDSISTGSEDSNNTPNDGDKSDDSTKNLVEYVAIFEDKYDNLIPREWGERVKGVVTRIDTKERIIALTFDACGNDGDGYDQGIIEFLINEGIPATLFISGRWIDKNIDEFISLAQNPLFDVANHGYMHKPLSVNGKSVYGISGTKSIGEVVEEIYLNEAKIVSFTGQKLQYYRSGTAYYDEISVQIASDLGYKVIGYNVLGDAGATYSEQQIVAACLNASRGSIILFHMNRPERGIASGIIKAITQLKEKGYTFVKLSDYDDQLR